MSAITIKETLQLLLYPLGPFGLHGDNLSPDEINLRQIRLLDEGDVANLRELSNNCKELGIFLNIKWMSIPRIDLPFSPITSGKVGQVIEE